MQITLVGTVEKVGDVEVIKGFSKRELSLNVDEDSKYPQTLCVEFLQQNVDKLNFVNEGDRVVVEVDLRGRRWQDRVFNSYVGWRCSIEAPMPVEPEVNHGNVGEAISDFDNDEDNTEYAVVSNDDDDNYYEDDEFNDDDILPF